MSRPGTVTAALVLWVLTIIASIIKAILAFVALGAAGAATASGILLAGAVIALIIALVEIAVLVAFSRGRNWARIVLTILGVLGIIGSITSISQGDGFSWVTLIVYILAIVLSFVGGANAFFRRN